MEKLLCGKCGAVAGLEWEGVEIEEGEEKGKEKSEEVGCSGAVDGLAMGGWRIRGRRRSHAGFEVVRGCLRW